MAAERIGFLGLGIMGSRMAANVARAGYRLAVWTHTPGKADGWVADHGGAQACATPAEVAARSEIVISMVVDGEQVAAVLLGEQGAIEGARPGTLFVDMSTIGPSQTRAIGAALEQRGAEMLDAPVTGSSPRAQDGTLTIMAGGSEQAFARAEPLLRTMGELVVHVGELGQGERVKLINNSLGAANAAALAEALVLAAAAGIDLDALTEVIAAGSGASAQLQLKARPMREHDYTTLLKIGPSGREETQPFFKLDHMLKDVRLTLEEANRAGIPFPAAVEAERILAAASEMGHGEHDYSSLIEVVEREAGARID